MTVEIRELVVRAKVVDSQKSPEGTADSSTLDEGNSSQTAIVSACVAQVLKILERRRER